MSSEVNVSYPDTKKAAPVLEHQSGRMEKLVNKTFSFFILQNYQEDCQV